jgi:hypothetical protein
MITKRKSALIAGITLLIMSVAAFFAYGYAHTTLILPDNPGVTFNNLTSMDLLFRLEVLGWLIIFVCDVVVAWALYVFLKDVSNSLSLLTAWLRMAYVALLGVAIFNFIPVLNILGADQGEPSYMAATQVMSGLQSFEGMWSLGLIVFGFHLLLLGYLVLISGYIHRVFGILLLIAAAGYLFVHVSRLLFADFEEQIRTVETILSIPMALGEIAFAIWLLVKGGRTAREPVRD